MVKKIRKRDGSVVAFQKEKIAEAIWKAVKSVGGHDKQRADALADLVAKHLDVKYGENAIPDVEEVQDLVEKVLIESGHAKTAKAYILYRKSRQELRDVKGLFDTIEAVEDYIGFNDWMVKENSNMGFSLQGLNNYIATKIITNYWMRRIYPEAIRKAHEQGDFHIHDLGTLGAYCVGWDLKDLITSGFKGVKGKVESRPAKHLRTALGQVVNFFYTLQGETAGAQAFSNFDTLLAPFVKKDNLDYTQVKQILQEFIFNLAVPTRVGFQCMSEDTEILTPSGWKGYGELEEGDTIKTFNIQKKIIENKPIKHLFARHYDGIMYNLKNRIQDQLISPNHRIVRKKFQTNEYVLEEVEIAEKMKSPFIIPIAGESSNEDIEMNDNAIKLLAWIIAEGTVENYSSHRHSSRVSIYQSAIKNPSKYEEIISLLRGFNLNYSEQDSTPALGQSVKMIRLNAESSRFVHPFFGTKTSVNFIPEKLLNMSQRQSRIFLETYIKADGFENSKIATTNVKILDGLQQIAVNAGYGFTVLKRNPTIGTKPIFVLRLIRHKETYIQKIDKVNYSGVIWCPNTDNETVIARRKGKVFITGNTPFTNITMDLKVPSYMKSEPAIIGGVVQKETYGEFQHEMNMINKAFAEVMLEGDASGRVFTFPIPTYNITKDFDWENPEYDLIWEMSAKYGIPYFSNFVNSDMNPEDARSMCCRLRLDQNELRKRGGGLFGANPQTGSIGVVTINMPRLGFVSINEADFFKRLEELMELAKESLEIKRKTVENFTEIGLYPYSKFYLRQVKARFGHYWQNHFATIGLLGMNESIVNFMPGENITTPAGRDFALRVLDFMRERLEEYQEETGNIYNLEATPGESTAYRFARIDKRRFGKIIVANEKAVGERDAEPYYTNSTQLPVNFTEDLFEALELQDELQTKYTGGCIEKGNGVLTDKGLMRIEEIVRNFKSLKPLKVISYNPLKGVSEWDEVTDAVSIDVQKHDKINIKGEKNLDIVTSDWHPFFVLEKMKHESFCPVCNGKVNGSKAFAVHIKNNKPCREKYKKLNKYKVIEKRADEIQKGDYILQNSFNLYANRKTKVDDDLMWLIGFFIGDGCISEFVDNRGGNNLKKYKIRFFSSSNKALDNAKRILSEKFNAEASVIQNDSRSKALKELGTSKKEVLDFFFNVGFYSGKKVDSISIPEFIKNNFNSKNVYSFISGLIDSDGHISKRDGDLEYSTISQKLAEDILETFTIAGISTGKYFKKSGRANEKDTYKIRVPQYFLTLIKDKLKINVNALNIKEELSNRAKRYLPVVRVKEASKIGVKDHLFYDLTTKKNHNYLAGKDCLVFVHNTVFHAFIGERLSKEAVKSSVKKVTENFRLPYFTITPTFSVCPIHGYIAGEHVYCPRCDEEHNVERDENGVAIMEKINEAIAQVDFLKEEKGGENGI